MFRRNVSIIYMMLVALASCAPMASMPSLLRAEPGRPYELGAAATYASSHPVEVSNPPPRTESCLGPCLDSLPEVAAKLQTTATGQMWYMTRGQGSMDVGVVAFANKFMVGSGGVLRWRIVDNDVFRLGFQAAAGWLWLAIAAPVSVNLGDQVAIYATPSVGAQDGWLRLPVGVAVEVSTSLRACFEAGAGLAGVRFASGGLGWKF